MANNYVKLPNQGTIFQNLMLLNAMDESDGYADSNGYFTKRAVAEIGVNSTIITSGGRFGDDILDTVNDIETSETDNPVLQNAKQRMQLLRCLGLISTDYDSELYAITDLGHKVLEQAFPESANIAPSFALLLESFMGLTTETEVYEYNCELGFNSYLGYCVCYALACLDYQLSVQELPLVTTYDVEYIDEYVDLVRYYRGLGQKIPTTHDHFPKTYQGAPLGQPTNITRVITQILRQCDIIKLDTVRRGGVNYYTCTSEGELYVEDVARLLKAQRFWTAREFRKQKLLQQKELALTGYNNMLARAGFDVGSTNELTVFSPYQIIPECWTEYLFGREPRKPPVSRQQRLAQIEATRGIESIRLKPRYFTEAEFEEFVKRNATADSLTHEIIVAKERGASQKALTDRFLDRHRNSSKEAFYPFVRALFSAMGLACFGEVGRIDCLLQYKEHDIPCEIKSFTETPTYNIKGARQAVDNWICTYRTEADLAYASLLVGFNKPGSTLEIENFIEAVYKTWGIKIVALDLCTLITMCIRSIWSEQKVDFDNLLNQRGIVEVL